jgi:hypothetical protein
VLAAVTRHQPGSAAPQQGHDGEQVLQVGGIAQALDCQLSAFDCALHGVLGRCVAACHHVVWPSWVWHMYTACITHSCTTAVQLLGKSFQRFQ